MNSSYALLSYYLRLSPTQYSLTSEQSWSKEPIISFHFYLCITSRSVEMVHVCAKYYAVTS